MTLEAYRASDPWIVERNTNLKLAPCDKDQIEVLLKYGFKNALCIEDLS